MKKTLVPLLFAVSAVLFLFAALTPVFRGQPLNAAYLSIGALSFVLALMTWRRTRIAPGPPSA